MIICYAGGDNEGHEEGDDEEMSAFEALQAERESEFLGQLIEPLQLLPEEYAQYATNDLGDRLRQTVSFMCFNGLATTM